MQTNSDVQTNRIQVLLDQFVSIHTELNSIMSSELESEISLSPDFYKRLAAAIFFEKEIPSMDQPALLDMLLQLLTTNSILEKVPVEKLAKVLMIIAKRPTI